MHDLLSDFEQITPNIWITNENGFKDKLVNLRNWSKIPLINSNASHNLPDGSLVRFKGMIQDMYDPEFYFETFEVYNTLTTEVKTKSGKYRDTSDVLENEKVNYTSNLKSAERQTLVAVSIPGFNDWAQQVEDKENHLAYLEHHPNSSKRLSLPSGSNLKRSFRECEDDDSDAMETGDNSADTNKEPRTSADDSNPLNTVSREHLLNFPLPDVSSKSCLIKTYEEDHKLKLNDVIEVVGFLSVDPILNGEFVAQKNSLLEPQIESATETITHNPPPSLVPRLHAVYVKKLDHCNPLVKQPIEQDIILQEANSAREHMLKALTELLLGDKLAAEYLICHLISCVYLRQEVLNLGQFTLNISNLPTKKYPNFAKQLYDIIQQFVTKSYYLPLTIDNMNSMALLPKKDYECNRLTSGILQLSHGTHLVLDETQMKEGQLDQAGVSNIVALGNLIKTQKVEYDFNYYKMEFDSDIAVLVFSEGKSLLPSDYYVPLKPEDSSLEIYDAIVDAATYYLTEEIMNEIRRYITNIKIVTYTINEDLKFVEDDFIEMRHTLGEEKPATADDLHNLLVLARLVSLSRGFDTLTRECWNVAKEMESERRLRIRTRANSAA